MAIQVLLLALGVGDKFRLSTGAGGVQIGIEVLLIEVLDARRVLRRDVRVPMCLRITAPFLAPTKPLSLECRGRDLVCSIVDTLA